MTVTCVVPRPRDTAPVQELEAFVADVAEWFTAPPSPMKTATYYQLQHRVQALNEQIKRQLKK